MTGGTSRLPILKGKSRLFERESIAILISTAGLGGHTVRAVALMPADRRDRISIDVETQ
jgi:hypothetical protein